MISLKSSSEPSADICSCSNTCTHWLLGAENIMLAPEASLTVLISRKYKKFLDFQQFHVTKSTKSYSPLGRN